MSAAAEAAPAAPPPLSAERLSRLELRVVDRATGRELRTLSPAAFSPLEHGGTGNGRGALLSWLLEALAASSRELAERAAEARPGP